jgi:hypothetical protein
MSGAGGQVISTPNQKPLTLYLGQTDLVPVKPLLGPGNPTAGSLKPAICAGKSSICAG